MPKIIVKNRSGLNGVLLDPSLSLKAKGLYCLLFHHGNALVEAHQQLKAKAYTEPYDGQPSEIQIQAERNWLSNASTDGKQSNKSACKELEATGYLVVTPSRSKGRYSTPTWHLH